MITKSKLKEIIREEFQNALNETDLEGVPFFQSTPAADADVLYKALKGITKPKPSNLGRGGNTGLGWGLMKTQMALPRNRRGGGSGHPVSNIPSFMMSRKKGWTDEKLKEGQLNEAKETIFDVAKRVMKDRQAQKYKSGRGQVMVDMQSANLLTKVWKKINPKMKKILSDLGYKNPAQLMNTLWAVAKAG